MQIDITTSKEIVPKGTLGIFEEALKKLDLCQSIYVEVSPPKKSDSVKYIKKKMDGKKLSYDEYKTIIEDIVNDKLSVIETSFFVAGCYAHPLDTHETAYLTKAMINTGDTLKLNEKIILDKHCIGGVAGNRTTMIVVPIIAAAGYKIPKTSSRSITSAAGTADTVEVLCKVSFDMKSMREIIEKTNGCLVWGGALRLAPSDDKIIHVESPLSIDPEGQLLASIMAKKKSVGTTHLLIDIPIGKGAKIEDPKKAKHLKKAFQKLCRELKIKSKIIITDGSFPIGKGIGPSLEARDVLWTLKNDPKGSHDLKEKAIHLAGNMLKIAGAKKPFDLARHMIDSGKAYHKFVEIIKAQGGRETSPEDIRIGRYKIEYKAKQNGYVYHINNKIMNRIGRIAGAPLDQEAGIQLQKTRGQKVQIGDTLFTVYSDSVDKLEFAKEFLEKESGYAIARTPPPNRIIFNTESH